MKQEPIGEGSPKRAWERWERYAHANDCRCIWCGSIVPHGEQDIYFSTGECGWCRHKLSKDD